MKILLLLINGFLVFVLYVFFAFCGAASAVLAASGMQRILASNILDSFKLLPFFVTAIELFLCALIIGFILKRLKFTKGISLISNFNGFEKEAIKSYIKSFLLSFVCSLILLIPVNFSH